MTVLWPEILPGLVTPMLWAVVPVQGTTALLMHL